MNCKDIQHFFLMQFKVLLRIVLKYYTNPLNANTCMSILRWTLKT